MFSSIRRYIRMRSVLKQVRQLQNMTVADIMTKYVITIRAEEDVIHAATKMIAEDISCLVVIENEAPVAVLSERDFLRKVPLSKAVFTMKVKDIMSPALFTVPPGTKLPEAVRIMKEKGFRRLVVAQDGKMLGVVTQTDFTRTLMRVCSSYPDCDEFRLYHIMTKDVLTITAKNTVAEAKQKMLKQDVGAILIMEKNVVMGIFTEYDLVMQFYDQHGKLDLTEIAKYMRKYVRAMPETANILEANRLMLDKNMRRLLVVDGDKVTGIVTQTDICRYMYTALDAMANAVLNQKNTVKRFSYDAEIHGEFRGEHLKVYSVE
jgi:two-component system, sensor histidine kinase and response regulator